MTLSAFILWLRRYQGWVGLAGFLCTAAGLYLGLVASPPDYYQGDVMRIMYVHVPLAQMAMLGYGTLAGASLWYLWKRDPIVDNSAHAAAGLSAFFTAAALVTGSIWAKPTWNVWWSWDPRLVSFTIQLLILIGYLMLRKFIEEPDRQARFSAVLAITGVVNLVIVKFSVEWWRSLHQPASIKPDGISYAPDMLLPLMVTSIGFLFLFTYMLVLRTQLLYLRQLLDAKKGRLLSKAHL